MNPKILSIGQCGFDHGSISGYLSQEFNAQVTAADSAASARTAMERESFDLILVNRIFDRDGDSGVAFIADADSKTPIMLVSNYEQHQQKAIAAGAAPGFGKSNLYSAEARQAIEDALANSQNAE